ncbi:hypothetical protein ACOMHN_054060 [Nucella lapillus]
MAAVVAEAASAVAIGASGLLCPVCHQIFSLPKILPCTHLVCRDCVLTLLKGDHLASCPLCLTPILPATDAQGQCDLDLFVDDLATDLVTMAKVEVESVLEGEDVCVCRARDAAAEAFCARCFVKLCAACARAHSRLPATQNHQLQDLATLNPDQLFRNRPPFPCPTHPHLPSDLFCPRHQQLICIMSAASPKHGECPDVVSVPDGARVQRARLREQIERMKKKTKTLEEKIQTRAEADLRAEASFQTTRHQITTTFHKLHQTLEMRQQDLLEQLNNQLDPENNGHKGKTSASRHKLEKRRQMLVTFTDLAERLVNMPDDFLLSMCSQIQPRLDEVEACKVPDVAGKADDTSDETALKVPDVGGKADDTGGDDVMVFDPESFEEFVEKIATFGAVTNSRRKSSAGNSEWVMVDRDDCTPTHHHKDSSESEMTNHPPPPPLVRQKSEPCSQCADDIVALDNGDLYTCHACTRVWLACDNCGYVVTLRHRDGFRSQVSECPECLDC